MRISTDFHTIPDDFSKHAGNDAQLGGEPIVSFPFYADDLPEGAQYLHWEFVDPDSIPVCGFEWIHWAVANLPIDALMYDFNDSHALAIPPDFSRTLPSMIPEAVQGRNSQASKLVNASDPNLTMRYTGPNPPDRDHEYLLRVWATSEPLAGLNQGFWLNEMLRELRHSSEESAAQPAGLWLLGRV
jgi:Raf kinase inhibitor-like YbhB/YbcL family protein